MLWQRVVAYRVEEQLLAFMERQARLPDYAAHLLCEVILMTGSAYTPLVAK